MKIEKVTECQLRSNSLPLSSLSTTVTHSTTSSAISTIVDISSLVTPETVFNESVTSDGKNFSGDMPSKRTTDHGESYTALSVSPDVTVQAADVSLVENMLQQSRSLTLGDAKGKAEDHENLPMIGDSQLSFAVPIAQRGRLIAQLNRQTTRLVQKSGDSNVSIKNVTKKKRKYIIDLMTTIMEMKWRYHAILFISTFAISWFLFGLMWYGLAFCNGDLSPEDNTGNESFVPSNPCVVNVFDLQTAVLFSLESQVTIGYGVRVIGANCPIGTALLMIQSCWGIFITCLTTGIVFGKISRPNRRSQVNPLSPSLK